MWGRMWPGAILSTRNMVMVCKKRGFCDNTGTATRKHRGRENETRAGVRGGPFEFGVGAEDEGGDVVDSPRISNCLCQLRGSGDAHMVGSDQKIL